MLYSINLRIMGNIPNIALLEQITIFNTYNPITILIIISLIIYFIYSYLLTTDFGLAMRSIGQNKLLATTVGIRVKHMTIIGLVLSNGLISFSGALFANIKNLQIYHKGLVQ